MQQTEFLNFTLDLLEKSAIPHMVVGSFASGVYGDPRPTRDVDIVIAPSANQIRRLCSGFPPDQFYVSESAALEALRQPAGQFNVIHPESGNKIDFMIAGRDEWGREQISRRRKMPLLPDREAYAASPEDIIISKMLYYQEGGSEKHLRDITGILKISGDLVDRAYVDRWSEQLGVTDVWQAVQARLR